MATKIAWCDETINPVVGCSKISAGCQNCYAENMARRLAAMGAAGYRQVISVGGWNGLAAFVPSALEKPYRWKRPRSIFIGSMGDMFHESVWFEWFQQVMRTVMELPRHTFIFLTKRPERMREWLSHYPITLQNLVIGVSVEDQQTADERIPVLLQTPAAKRFVSLEPLVGPVDLEQIRYPDNCRCDYCGGFTGGDGHDCYDPGIPDGIHGVILGGESGNKARRMSPEWVTTIRDQCESAEIPFMFKQWNHENRNEVDPDTGFPWLGDRTHSELAW